MTRSLAGEGQDLLCAQAWPWKLCFPKGPLQPQGKRGHTQGPLSTWGLLPYLTPGTLPTHGLCPLSPGYSAGQP